MIACARTLGSLVTAWVVVACSSRLPAEADTTRGDPAAGNVLSLPISASAKRVPDCEGPAASLDLALVAALPPRDGRMIPDDQWADLAAVVPGGFAGVLYIDGKPVLALTTPAYADAARKALAPALPGFDVAGAEIRKARWTFAQLVDWYNFITTRTTVWQIAGLTTSGRDELRNRIRFGVVDAEARDRLVQGLRRISLPCDLINVEITGEIRSLGG